MPDRAAGAILRLARRQLSRGAYVWAGIAYVTVYGSVKGYESAYPTAQGRQKIAALVERNPAFQAINGVARRLDTPGGYVTWRIGAVLMVVVGAWAAVTATRLFRGEEDAGRADMVRAGAVTGVEMETAMLTALTGGVVLFGLSVWAGLLSARLPMAGSALLALAVTACGLLFGAAGALTSQLFSPRRRATQMAMLALGVSFAVRIVADGTRGLGWLRWCTPFGWAEQTHAFTGDVWWPVSLVLVTAAAVVAPALVLQRRRDMGSGALFADRRAHSRMALLGSPARFALRSEISTVLVWAASLGAYAVLVGVLAKDVSSFVATSRGFQDVAARLATATLSRPEGFLALIFTFFAPPVALMGVFQVGAARIEESAGRAEIVLATAVPRWRWLLGRVVVGTGGVVFAALCAGLLAWTGTALKGGGVGLAGMERAAVNMLPAALLFLALAVAAFGVQPRLTVAVGAGAVALTYVLELVGALLRAPSWVLDISPFHHLAAVPIAPVNARAALVMLTVAACLVAVGIVAFDRRDVAGL